MGYLAALLSGDTVAGLDGARVVGLAFQQAPREAVDDLVISAQRDGEGSPSLTVAVGVRRRPLFTRSDAHTQKLLADYLRSQTDSLQACVDREYALVVAGPQNAATEVATLAGLARTSTQAEFFKLVEEPGRFKQAVRTRLEHFRSLIAGALNLLDAPSAEADVRLATWRLLTRLTVLQPRYETSDVSDWEQLLNSLRPIALEGTLEGARALRDRLEVLAGVYGPQAATIDRTTLLRDVQGLITSNLTQNHPGWTALRRLERTARATIRATIGLVPGQDGVHLERESVLSSLRTHIRDEDAVLIHGASGSGKSALILAAIDAEKADDAEGFDAVYLNLRQLPDSGLSLDAALGAPLGDLLGLLTAPRRLLVIDGADYLTEAAATAFAGMIQSARDADVRLAIVATGEATEAVRAELGPAVEVTPFLIPGLDDADLEQVAESNPRLQGLFSTSRSRDLLRRPVIADLLVRAHASTGTVTEVDAMAQVWRALVRRNDGPEHGAPAARDFTLKLLAEHALGRMDDDELLRLLDLGVVEALRRDGILAPTSDAPWQRIPEFFHEQLRLYAVSQVLLAHADPVAELLTASAPRWALPAARLAAQYLLAADDSLENPLAGRFERLQDAFDRLAAAGHGERWADVPAESVLPLPASDQILAPAWTSLAEGGGAGLRRIFRLIQQRHFAGPLVDPSVAEPIVSALLENGWPRESNKDAAHLIRNWLQALVAQGATVGHALRVRLRDRIVGRVADADDEAAESARAAEAALAARTPEQIAEDEARRSQFPILSGPIGFGRRRQEKPRQHQPRELTDETVVEQLGLLGPDLGKPGEALLRRIAEHAPSHLEPAVETPLAGRAIAAYRPGLLVELAEAYYINDVHPEDDDFGWYGHEKGVRHHGYRDGTTPFSSPYRGPFLAMLQTDFRGGVSFLIRLLNHAALCRVKGFRSWQDSADPVETNSVTLSITGAPRRFVGDLNVWLWYRGGGVGRYPCMSALQALELVTDQLIAGEAPMERLVELLMPDCENLAMPAFVVGMLVRHLERSGNLLDPYLSEPEIWQLEFARTVQEGTGMLSRSDTATSPDRRKWSFREVAMMLALHADATRAAELEAIADLLEQRARDQLALAPDAEPDATGAQYLAAVAGWASSLRRGLFRMTETDEGVIIEATVPDAVAAILEPGHAEGQLMSEAYGLINRYDFGRHSLAGPPSVDLDELRADVEVARRILAMENFDSRVWLQACSAVACSVIERRYIAQDAFELNDLNWAAELLLEIAALYAAQPESDALDFSYFAHDPDIAASRAVALLLLPDAADLVRALGPDDGPPYEKVIAANRWAATLASLDDRMAWSRSLDTVWSAAPIDLPGRGTSHDVILELIEHSIRGCVIGDWDDERQQRRPASLTGPLLEALAAAEPDDVVAERLIPGIRALQQLATRTGVAGESARMRVNGLVGAYTTVRQHEEHGPQHSSTDMLTIARALLILHESGHPEPILRQLEAVIDRNDLLDEFMDAISAVGEENSVRGRTTASIWPALMDHAMNLMDIGHLPVGDGFLAARGIASLIPNPTYDNHYLVRELDDIPISWIDFDTIAPHVPRWLPFAAGHRESVDQLIAFLRLTSIDQQVELGLPWVEELVRADPASIAGRSYLLPEWLKGVRAAARPPVRKANWQRVVDQLLVAGDERVADLAD
ncbi:hypothetical protein [Agromyces mediolanus]|uniref:hypothetical protein n=1 Tax=Agromyces mediolanus TaxID=41986 RepID=UPI001E5108FC|nr:hypothetical protein [Agromyces mediolanus]MCD1573257.1 hypothetical protein [Agromyces mediolanus]